MESVPNHGVCPQQIHVANLHIPGTHVTASPVKPILALADTPILLAVTPVWVDHNNLTKEHFQ